MTYSLPLPFEMYAYGAAAALILSFVLIGYFAKRPAASAVEVRLHYLTATATRGAVNLSRGIALCRVLSILGLTLTVATGLCGNPSVFSNFSMPFFWVIFALGFAYLTALAGDLFSLISPWVVLADGVQRLCPKAFVPRWPYPSWAAYWPSILLYGIFIWIELFGHVGPRLLAIVLLAYTLLTLLGACIFGRRAWFTYAEFFGVFLRLIAMLGLLDWVVVEGRINARPRRFLVALTRAPADHPTLVMFILFMLSSTAFDGAHETLPWVNLFWKHVFPEALPLISAPGRGAYEVAPGLYYAWQSIMLGLSPLVYFGGYQLFIWMTKVTAGSALTVRQLSGHFALSLVPIAFVYNVAHYFTLLLSEGPNVVARASDPFGWGWDLFGTATHDLSVIPPAALVWHAQVWLILAGHIAGIYIAHMIALQLSRTRAEAVRSQLPMLCLMVLLTGLGLWILSLPISAGQVVTPADVIG